MQTHPSPRSGDSSTRIGLESKVCVPAVIGDGIDLLVRRRNDMEQTERSKYEKPVIRQVTLAIQDAVTMVSGVDNDCETGQGDNWLDDVL